MPSWCMGCFATWFAVLVFWYLYVHMSLHTINPSRIDCTPIIYEAHVWRFVFLAYNSWFQSFPDMLYPFVLLAFILAKLCIQSLRTRSTVLTSFCWAANQKPGTVREWFVCKPIGNIVSMQNSVIPSSHQKLYSKTNAFPLYQTSRFERRTS